MKNYDKALQARVDELREDLGAQPLSALRHADQGLWEDRNKLRRILSKRVFPGDLSDIIRMEKAKKKLLKLRK